jgi:hypothetical protein
MNTFENYNILSWTIDDFEQFNSGLAQQDPSFNLNDYVQDYKNDSFDDKISLLFDNAPFKLNLGGSTDKSKLTTTDKPMGIFDFSLASRGLYRVPEYYSSKLAIEKPKRFEESGLASGVVPAIFVTERTFLGKKQYIFTDGGVDYECEVIQKGEMAIEQGVPGAKLKYATRNRKVYLTYKRKRGKVKYVEIYSLFYYTSLSGDTQFAIRHIPALMVAEYFESVGIKVRFYMTRFVDLSTNLPLRSNLPNGTRLPMYDISRNTTRTSRGLFVQPFIVKEFGQEMDKAFAFMVSSSYHSGVYGRLAEYALKTETTNNNPHTGGNPDWSQNDYFEGVERYRNKYQEYVKLGIFKSKEVLPEAMVFFHDMVIKWRINRFLSNLSSYFPNKSQDEALIDVNVNGFFTLWMRASANVLKHKINIINSDEMMKDITEIDKDLHNTKDEFELIIQNVAEIRSSNSGEPNLREYLREFGTSILGKLDESRREYGYNVIGVNGNITLKRYVTNITDEITTYAEGNIYATPIERQEFRNEILMNVLKALENFK